MREGGLDLLPAMPLDAGLVLQIGCGAGELGRAYRSRNPRAVYVGVDRQAAQVAGLSAVVDGDIEQAEALARLDRLRGERRFDLLVLDGALEELAEPAGVLAELRARMQPGATCAVRVDDAATAAPLSESTITMFRRSGWSITDARLCPPVAEAPPAAGGRWIIRCINGPAPPPLKVSAMTPPKFAGITETRTEEPLAALASRPGVWVSWQAQEMNTRGAPGLLVFQRMLLDRDDAWAAIQELIARGWTTISDMDDDPRHFPLFVDTNFRAFRGVHAVSVSTEPLARLMRDFNPNLLVLPNAIDALPDPPSSTPKSGARLRVFFGALNRGGDWGPMMAPLYSVLAALADRVEVVVIHDRAFFDALPSGVSRRFHPTLAYADYKAVLHGCDIALLPLADTAFNRLKSDIKLIECCAAGVVPICSSTVYGDDPRNAAVSVMVDRPQAFADALAALSADLPRLAQLRAAGRAYVAAERMHAYQVQAREAFYRQVVQDRAALELQRRERMARHGI